MVLFFLSPYALPDYFLGELMQSSRKLEGFSTDEALTNAPMSSAQSSCLPDEAWLISAVRSMDHFPAVTATHF
jgi:hypothetical protein